HGGPRNGVSHGAHGEYGAKQHGLTAPEGQGEQGAIHEGPRRGPRQGTSHPRDEPERCKTAQGVGAGHDSADGARHGLRAAEEIVEKEGHDRDG
ncbi:hypothetical protein DF186_14885, partial [Enterococcus hirae]